MKHTLYFKYKKINLYPFFWLTIKILIGISAVSYLISTRSISPLSKPENLPPLPFLLFFFLFSLANWFLEIKRWQYLATPVRSLSFYNAFRQSLISFSLSLLTPNRIGEFGAKSLFYSKEKQKKIMLLSASGSMIQMFVTLLMGTIGLFFLFFSKPLLFNKIIFQTGHNSKRFLFLIVLSILLFFLLHRYKNKVKTTLSTCPCTFVFIFSIGRYFVFSVQFLFIWFFLHHYTIGLLLFPAISIMYLISSLVPVLSLVDWAIKGSVALWIFSSLDIPSDKIILVTSLMWIMNFFIPFLIGIALFIYTPKNK